MIKKKRAAIMPTLPGFCIEVLKRAKFALQIPETSNRQLCIMHGVTISLKSITARFLNNVKIHLLCTNMERQNNQEV